ncbi:hypothetical protein QQF64_014229 [Cirrhinus molitorella]|uniref:Uncharacterized protein n=1 Tax=Cirrhinus molitorella TaxID=172907 RepID=A0ABR3LTH6_9TELE
MLHLSFLFRSLCPFAFSEAQVSFLIVGCRWRPPIPDPSALTHLGISLWAYLLLFSGLAVVAVARRFRPCAGRICRVGHAVPVQFKYSVRVQFRPYEGIYLGKLYTPVISALGSVNRLCQTTPERYYAL